MKSAALQSLKFAKLKRMLKLTHWQCVGLLEAVWLFTQTNAPLGDIGRHTDEDIAGAIEWEGSAADLLAALVACGWLDVCDENRLLVHDWKDHAPTYLKGGLAKNGVTFKLPAKQAAKQVAKQPAKQVAKHPAKEGALHGALLTKPNQTKPNQTKPEESGEPVPPASPPAVPHPPAAPVMTYPTIGHGPDHWELTAEQLREWSNLYPGVGVETECRKALAWCIANRTKRKTARGMPAFLVNWLNKSNDRAPAGRPAAGGGKPPGGTAGDFFARKLAEMQAAGTPEVPAVATPPPDSPEFRPGADRRT